MSSIASSLDLTAKSLRLEFPELSKQVVARYKLFLLSSSEERDNQIKEIGIRAIDEMVSKGRPITFRNFQSVIGKALLPESRLRKFFNEVHR